MLSRAKHKTSAPCLEVWQYHGVSLYLEARRRQDVVEPLSMRRCFWDETQQFQVAIPYSNVPSEDIVFTCVLVQT